MFNKYKLSLLLIFISFQAPAQIYWGLKGGVNVSSLGTTGQYKPRIGYHFGTYYSQHIESQYGWQIGLQYSLQGARDAANTNGRLAYHYINMPLVMKFYFSESTYAEVGPQVGYLLNAKYIETGFKDDRTEGVQKWDISGLIGLGHETDSGTSLGLRFGFGFTNTSGATIGSGSVFRNLLFQAFVSFNLKEFDY